MSNENPERNPRPTKKHKSKKTTSSPTLPPCVIPPDTQPSQTLESSQTSSQVGITHLAHLIEETIETESDLHNPELEFTRVFGQGKHPREATESKSTIPGLTPKNFDQLLQKAYDKVNSTEFTRFIWKKVQKHEKAKPRIQDKPRNVLMGEIKPTIQSTVQTVNKLEISFSR